VVAASAYCLRMFVCRAYEGIYLCTAGRVVDCYLFTCFPVTPHQRLWFLVCASDISTYFHVDSFCHFRAYSTHTHIYSLTHSQTRLHTHSHMRTIQLRVIEAHSPQTHQHTHTRRCDSLTHSLTYSHIHYTPTCLSSRHSSSCFACLFHKMKNKNCFPCVTAATHSPSLPICMSHYEPLMLPHSWKMTCIQHQHCCASPRLGHIPIWVLPREIETPVMLTWC
jgi:hypothetical protein